MNQMQENRDVGLFPVGRRISGGVVCAAAVEERASQA